MASQEPESIAASELAGKIDKMFMWSTGAKAHVYGDPHANSTLMDDYKASKWAKWPNSIRALNSSSEALAHIMGRKHVESGMQAFFGQILVRSTALFGEDDPCGLNWQLPMLCNEYNKMLLFKDKNEATQRVPVDNIMSNVFIQSGLYVVVNEAAACMRKCDIIHASSEQINFLVTRNLTNPRSAVSFIDSLDELSRFYWRLKVDPVDRSYMVFPVEHKPKATIESRNQILFDLASNLSHRATNLMPNNPVYGATCNRGEFTLYEGRMEEGSHSTARVVVHLVETWNLYNFYDLVEVFCLLHFLADKFDAEAMQYSQLEINLEHSPLPNWRALPPKSSSSKKRKATKAPEGDADSTRDADDDAPRDTDDQESSPSGVARPLMLVSRRSNNQQREAGTSIAKYDMIQRFLADQAAIPYDILADTETDGNTGSNECGPPSPEALGVLYREVDELALFRTLPCTPKRGRELLDFVRRGGSIAFNKDEKHTNPVWIL